MPHTPLLNWGNKISEKVRRVQELRRSNSATAIPSKKKYKRKTKFKQNYLNE